MLSADQVRGEGEERHADQPDGAGLRALAVPRSCRITMAAENSSITESRPKPTRAMEAAITPAVMATPASIISQAILAVLQQEAPASQPR